MEILLLIALAFLQLEPVDQEARFFKALGQIESGNNPKAIGDNGNAIGMYQLWKIYVDDVNRILGKRVFIYSDRYCPAKSRRMISVYMRHYATDVRLGRPVTFIDAARIHNGGPNGWRKEATVEYGRKFKGLFNRTGCGKRRADRALRKGG